MPGELFVHRSIANLVSADDASVMSALQYALEVLKVEHVIVCGHEACGGVRASLLPPEGDESAADNYLARHIRPLRDLYRRRSNEVNQGIADSSLEDALMARTNRLVALNVSAQVHAMATMPLVRGAWQRGQLLTLHGWVYGLSVGRLRPLLTIDAEAVARAA
ncbi:MAG TPA: carbonic anhydrase [Burkholderiaceae bacterium]|nr:carbonic anhydrase [Burkholderiaceae bacterium]